MMLMAQFSRQSDGNDKFVFEKRFVVEMLLLVNECQTFIAL